MHISCQVLSKLFKPFMRRRDSVGVCYTCELQFRT